MSQYSVHCLLNICNVMMLFKTRVFISEYEIGSPSGIGIYSMFCGVKIDFMINLDL